MICHLDSLTACREEGETERERGRERERERGRERERERERGTCRMVTFFHVSRKSHI